ncbi:MAG: leucyl aminopeptidase family protein [Hyphomicrobiaceae bacterium]
MATQDVFVAGASKNAVPVWCMRKGQNATKVAQLSKQATAWLKAHDFKANPGERLVIPGSDGKIEGVLFGFGSGEEGAPSGPSEILLGQLARSLPAGTYKLEAGVERESLAAISWALGAYTFQNYKTDDEKLPCRLVMPKGVDADEVEAIVEAVSLGRDLINTPASDLGPAELEEVARRLGKKHKAKVTSIVGEDLLKENFPMIHAVGRASDRAPRLIDLRWKPPGAKGKLAKVTLVGKGIVFDTGGLDLKPAAAMILMKKDMGGAAAVLALGSMIMAQKLPVQLRILIPSAENSVSSNAFRPSDVLTSRAGKTVEIGNTDAEGRLVLADALALADEEDPDTLISMATLTGAARVALGPDLPAFFTNDDDLAIRVGAISEEIGDPVWRMPFWKSYDKTLKSTVADMNNISNGPFAGAITAALFLQRFVTRAHRYAHIDLYGWRPTAGPLGLVGGEPHAARAVYESIKQEVSV